jgi:nucleotide-binding universal stress UspA family protein
MTLIVVGTDGSPTASEALAKAIELAKQSGGKLAIVSAYKPMAGRVVNVEGSHSDARKWADGLSDSKVEGVLREAAAKAGAAGIESETHLRKGDAADALIEIAEEEDADLIVVGNRGMTGARRILGSVPNKVTHHAPCSVMVVRTG